MLEVVEPGLLSSVQDLGRPEAVDLGVPEGGACDRWSLGVANALAGNDRAAAALEVTLAGPRLRVLADCLVGLAGADLGAQVEDGDHQPVTFAPGSAQRLRAGQHLAFGVAGERQGIRAYLAIAGGLDIPPVLGSASTCLVAGFGGHAGRPLATGDVLRSSASGDFRVAEQDRQQPWSSDFRPALEATRRALRVVPGPHLDRLSRGSFRRLLSTQFRVSARADRQGIRLDGSSIPVRSADPMLSQGVAWGSIQLPPDGQPIVLLSDHHTVGGYPVVAVVISADLPLLGQVGPGDPLSFREVSFEEAQSALRGQEHEWLAATERLRRG